MAAAPIQVNEKLQVSLLVEAIRRNEHASAEVASFSQPWCGAHGTAAPVCSVFVG
jgi:hypothetical protein